MSTFQENNSSKRLTNGPPLDQVGLQINSTVREKTQSPRGLPEIGSLVYAAGHHILLTGLLASCFALSLGFLAAIVVPPQYLASGLVKVSQREGYLLTTRQSRSDDALFLRAQESNVVQQTTLERALKNVDLQAALANESITDEVDWLRTQIKADIPTGSELLTITASNRSPKFALLVSKAVTQAYVDLTTEQHQAVCQKRIVELEEAATEADEQLRLRWKGLRHQAERLGAGNPQSLSLTEQMKINDYRESSQRLRGIRLQQSQLEIQLAEQKKKVESPIVISNKQVQEQVYLDREVASRVGHIRELDVKIKEIQGLASDPHSARIVRLRAEREEFVNQFEQLVAIVEQRVRDKFSSMIPAATPSAIESLEKQLSLLQEEEGLLHHSVNDLENSIERISGPNSVELEITRSEIAREKELADSLWKTLQELRIEEQAEPRVALISLPKNADKLTRSKQLKAVAAAMMSGILFAILGVGYVEWSTCRIRYPDDVQSQVGLEFFGCMKGKSNRPWFRGLWGNASDTDRNGASEAAARMLRDFQSNSSTQSLFVTSAVRSEPRSRVADELAEVLAANGRRVLLVNCDRSERSLDQAWSVGVSEFDLSRDWNAQVQSSAEYGYDYLPLTDGSRPLSIVASQTLEPLLQEAHQSYDFVVVLGPAILSTAEGVFLSFRTQRSLLAIRMGESCWDTLAAARSRLEASRSVVLGVVSHNDQPTQRAGMHSNKANDRLTSPIACTNGTPLADEEALHREVRKLQDQLISHENHDQLRPPTKLATRRNHAGGTNRNSE